MRWHSERVFVLSLPGLSQPAQGPHHGGSRHCAPGHGHPHPSCSRTHGGRPPDVDPLDAQNHRGGGTHCPAAGPHTASHRAALQGEQAEKRKTKCTLEKGGEKTVQKWILCRLFVETMDSFKGLSNSLFGILRKKMETHLISMALRC